MPTNEEIEEGMTKDLAFYSKAYENIALMLMAEAPLVDAMRKTADEFEWYEAVNDDGVKVQRRRLRR